MADTVDLSKGGMATVIVGEGMDIPEPYAFNKQVHSLAGSNLPQDADGISARIPSTTKIVLIAGRIDQKVFGAFRAAMAKRRMTFMIRENDAALKQALDDCFPKKATPPPPNGSNGGPAPVTEERKIAAKGSVKEFIEKHADLKNPTKSNAEEARRLFSIAQREGLDTTLGSLSQGIAVARKKIQLGSIPKSVQTRQQQCLQVLDEAIVNLSVLRDYVAEVEQKNFELQEALDTIHTALAGTVKKPNP